MSQLTEANQSRPVKIAQGQPTVPEQASDQERSLATGHDTVCKWLGNLKAQFSFLKTWMKSAAGHCWPASPCAAASCGGQTHPSPFEAASSEDADPDGKRSRWLARSASVALHLCLTAGRPLHHGHWPLSQAPQAAVDPCDQRAQVLGPAEMPGPLQPGQHAYPVHQSKLVHLGCCLPQPPGLWAEQLLS